MRKFKIPVVLSFQIAPRGIGFPFYTKRGARRRGENRERTRRACAARHEPPLCHQQLELEDVSHNL